MERVNCLCKSQCKICFVSVSRNGKEWVFIRQEYIYRKFLSSNRLQNRGKKIKVAEVVVSTNHVTFLTNRFPRLISLPTSAIFVSGTSGITAILKYRGLNPIETKGRPKFDHHRERTYLRKDPTKHSSSKWLSFNNSTDKAHSHLSSRTLLQGNYTVPTQNYSLWGRLRYSALLTREAENGTV